jgi:hypothetical protein
VKLEAIDAWGCRGRGILSEEKYLGRRKKMQLKAALEERQDSAYRQEGKSIQTWLCLGQSFTP